MGKLVDLTGKRFGTLLVKSLASFDKFGHAKFNCLCDCGAETIVLGDNIKRRNPKGCPTCKDKRSQELINSFIGQIFGRLTVLKFDKNSSRSCKKYICRCNCVDKTIVSVYLHGLKSGEVKGCGCLNRENLSKRSKLQTGKNHPRWNSELTIEERLNTKRREDNPEYYEWRKLVFERDNYTCQVSGEVGGKLCVHHIYNWADNKELRYTPTNGVTISEKLHKLFHKIYGKRNTTLEQFIEFKNKQQIHEK